MSRVSRAALRRTPRRRRRRVAAGGGDTAEGVTDPDMVALFMDFLGERLLLPLEGSGLVARPYHYVLRDTEQQGLCLRHGHLVATSLQGASASQEGRGAAGAVLQRQGQDHALHLLQDLWWLHAHLRGRRLPRALPQHGHGPGRGADPGTTARCHLLLPAPHVTPGTSMVGQPWWDIHGGTPFHGATTFYLRCM